MEEKRPKLDRELLKVVIGMDCQEAKTLLEGNGWNVILPSEVSSSQPAVERVWLMDNGSGRITQVSIG